MENKMITNITSNGIEEERYVSEVAEAVSNLLSKAIVGECNKAEWMLLEALTEVLGKHEKTMLELINKTEW